ncbi:uncharacterized protein CIMG_12696 [Coccidioides immitis RS]|uniref:Uncharacterized protein n=1 Tax=Coccidioides immitis (strain RS) TaxID=246410 RepID=A0A0D8JSS4_COCIM|nr:uncharacterized protein CIMG_12696 [Coccidioides immitis RS]KJF60031.1 hypothetical protein CIMG_12696 [Coccidioides immitis RS]
MLGQLVVAKRRRPQVGSGSAFGSDEPDPKMQKGGAGLEEGAGAVDPMNSGGRVAPLANGRKKQIDSTPCSEVPTDPLNSAIIVANLNSWKLIGLGAGSWRLNHGVT